MNSFINNQQNLIVKKGKLGIAWTGQAGFAFKDSSGIIYYVDPYLSNICSETIGYHRLLPPPVKAKNVEVNFILITHAHKDHLDERSLPAIAKSNPTSTLVAPPSCIHRLMELGISSDKLITIQCGQERTIGNIVVKAVLAHHTTDSIGYILRFEGTTIYITGDTIYKDDLMNIKNENPHVVIACINGRLGCMNISDAARLVAHLQPEFAVPMHFGMFKENTANPNEFIHQVEAYNGVSKGFIMEMGTWYLFNKKQGFLKPSNSDFSSSF